MDDWGYLGEDWKNPAVEIDLNPLGAGEGVAVKKKKPGFMESVARGASVVMPPVMAAQAAKAVAAAIKRPMTTGEKKTLQTLVVQKAAENVRNLMTKPASIIPSAAKASMTAAVAANPVAAAAAFAKPLIAKQKADVMRQAQNAVAQQKQQSVAAMKDAKEKLDEGIKTGAITPAMAKSIMQAKAKEIRQQNKSGLANIKQSARAKAGSVLETQAKIQAALIRKSDVAADQARQKIEAEIRSVSASSMPEPGKSSILKTLKDRLARLDLAKKELTKRKQVATVAQMAAKGALTKGQAAKLSKDITKKADAMQEQRGKMAKKAKTSEQMKARLYLLGKWIQAYESAIRYAQEAGVTSVVIPIGTGITESGAKPAVTRIPAATIKSKVVKQPIARKPGIKGLGAAELFRSYPAIGNIGRSEGQLFQSYTTVGSLGATSATKEVRMPIQTAKAKLEKFKMQYKKIEATLSKNAGQPGLPLPKVIPVTQTGQQVTPEMLKAQETYLRAQIAAGKINAVRGAQAIAQLKKVDTIMKDAHKPILTAKKPGAAMTIQVFISPESFKYFAAGERMVTTPGGGAKTKALLPKEKLPSAIPHATAKTAGTVRQMVRSQPANAPSVVAARPAQSAQIATSRMGAGIKPSLTPGASTVKPGTITPVKRKQHIPKTVRSPRSVSPFKKVSMTDILNQMVPIAWPKRR